MTHQPKRALAAIPVAIAMAMAAATAQAQTAQAPSETNFQVRTTGDLVQLCEAAPTDPTGIAALHFCQGFAVGAYQYHQIVTAAEGKRQLVCAPNPPPSRNEAVAAFIAWAKQNPQQMNTPPVEGLFRFLSQRYPCRV
ncbi:Rap1a/Tai family immunity protein [Azospirillum canadense]|uniref:Rap1a/Tai family immunity protein n=1 Tax=Azospirillum canadense TaxID=403962 RepID=UPI00222634BB|nr:Rap1a/Tai family immunity protein [Azospirillum canadense]MCW2241243.1 hypothetical protein [Azospirillum canadense]